MGELCDILDDVLGAISAGDSLAASVDVVLRKTAELLEAPVAWCVLVTPGGASLLSLRTPPIANAPTGEESECLLWLLAEAAHAGGVKWAAGPRVAALGADEVVAASIEATSLSGVLVAGLPSSGTEPEHLTRLARLSRQLGRALSLVHRRQGLWEASRRHDAGAAVLSSIVGLLGATEIASGALRALREATGWPAVRLWRRRENEIVAEGGEPGGASEPGLLVSETLQMRLTRLGDNLQAIGGGWRGIEFAVPLSAQLWGEGVLSLATTDAAPFTLADVALVEEVATSVASALARGAAHDAAKNESRLSAALAEQSADYLLVTDRSGQIQYVNRAFEQHTGWSREELVGRTPSVLRSGVHPQSDYTKLWKTILSGHVFRGTLVNRTRSGRLYHEEKTIAPIRDESGHVSHFVSVGRDISERIEADLRQGELRESVERSSLEWSATFDALEFPVLILDAADQVVRANTATRDLAKTTFSQLIGQPLPPDSEGPWPSIRLAVRIARKRSLQLSAFPSGDPPVTWHATAHVLPAGVLARHIIVVARDITAITLLQENIRRNETMATLGAIVAGVAHEVRNPLFAITAILEAFEAEFALVPAFPQFRSLLRSECQRLISFMNDLLEYGRPTRILLAPQAIGDVIERSIRPLEAVARNAGVELVVDMPAGLPLIAADLLRVGEVFVNLIENAIQHSPSGGRVSTRARLVNKNSVQVTVEDQGPGIPPEFTSRIFEPFFTTRRGGTGLGLAIVRRIVDEHGGTISIENGPERGAVATVELLTLDLGDVPGGAP